MPMTRFIRVKTQFEGLHRWPKAPAPDDYLRSPHRHLFVVEADIEVFHDDREVEINEATRWLDTIIPGFADQIPATPGADPRCAPLDFGTRSCEELAALTAEAILNRFGRDRSLRCAVLEDGILGAGVSWTPMPDH